METKDTRVRLNLKQTSKGDVYFDITAEAPTVEKAGQLLDVAISEVKVRAKENNLVLVNRE